MSDHNRPASSEYFQGKLYQQMHDDLHLAGKAPRTVNGYLRSVRQLADYCQCSPDQVSEQQLRNWLLYLKNEKEFAYGSLRVAFSGIKFFFTRTYKRDWETLKATKLRNVKSLPEVLTRQQVHLIIDACTTQRMATYFWTVYSLGLRVEEGLNLHIGDVDGKRMMVHVHRGKGAKDRYIPLPASTLVLLREYWKIHRHACFLFPADGRNHTGMSTAKQPMSPTAVQSAIKRITRQLKFGKKISTHTLRHSYASHLLEAGVSLKAIQKFLGHSSLQTTMVYLHLTHTAEADACKVVDKLFVRQPKQWPRKK